MKIHADTGSIQFSGGTVERAASVRDFLDSAIGRTARRTLQNDRWQHFEFNPEAGIAGTVLFEADRITRILLAMALPSDTAHDWSTEVEQRRKVRHDAWLRTELGEPPYEFSWGRVASEYDSKGCASEIIVVYDR